MDGYIRGFIAIVRYLIPLLSLVVVISCTLGLLRKNNKYKVSMITDDDTEFPLDDGEYVVGKETGDINLSGVKESHFVISICKNIITLRPLFKNKLAYNRHFVKDEVTVGQGEVLTAGERKFAFKIKENVTTYKIGDTLLKLIALGGLTLIQFFIMLSLFFNLKSDSLSIIGVFGAVMLSGWIYFIARGLDGAFVEIPVLFLITLGMSVAAHKGSDALYKLFICFIIGVIGSFIISGIISAADRAVKFRMFMLLIGVGLFFCNIAFGVVYNGAQNWINIAGFSVQPSEFAKVSLVFISGALIEKAESKRDIAVFTAFSFFAMAVLAYLSDFGTALIYAVVFFVVVAIRLCNIKLIVFLLLCAAVLGVVVVFAFPYVADRIFSFGQAWENASGSGYQQTRAMIASASGGLFGVGGGNGKLIKIPAADTDIVFGLVSEELGLIVSLCAVFCFVLFTLYALKLLKSGANIYYGITATATAVLLLTQASLNVLGTLDMLPFTGVTLPFISNGGSSLIASLLLISFFRTPLKKEGRCKNEKS